MLYNMIHNYCSDYFVHYCLGGDVRQLIAVSKRKDHIPSPFKYYYMNIYFLLFII